jgi:hypothetical protein
VPQVVSPAAEEAMCERAVERLLEFSRRPLFKRAVQNAFEAFWSPEFLQLPDDEVSRIMTSPEAETSMVTYMTLDAPATRDAAIVELFLAQQGKYPMIHRLGSKHAKAGLGYLLDPWC